MSKSLPVWPHKAGSGPEIRVGVIGGSGLYKLEGIELVGEVEVQTPWGSPSSPISIGKTSSGVHVAFLARHGRSHSITPSSVPSLANISALKSLGVKGILAFSAVGSLREEIKPKDFVVPSQIIDRTKGIRRASFFGEGEEKGVVAHAGFGDPFEEKLRPLVSDVISKTLSANNHSVGVHTDKTVICMEGPQFSTRAESLMYRSWGGDIINMSVLPESKLAREAELSYVLVATATDYDAWRPSSASVNVAEVMEALRTNVEASQKVTLALLDPIHQALDPDGEIVKGMQGSMKWAVMTNKDVIPQKAKENLRFLWKDFAV